MSIINVNSKAQLDAAINGGALPGDTIILAAAVNFGDCSYSGRAFNPAILVAALSPSAPAILSSLAFNAGCRGITVQNVRFNHVLPNNASVICSIDASSYITIETCRLFGAGNRDTQPRTAFTITYAGVRSLNGSSFVQVRNCEITNCSYPTLTQNATDIKIFGNYIHRWSGGDAIMVQLSQRIEADENYITAYYRPSWEGISTGVHANGMQTDNGGGSGIGVTDFKARKNFMTQTQAGEGSGFESMFLVTGWGPLVVTDNVVFDPFLTGIYCGGYTSSDVLRNSVLYNRFYIDPTAPNPIIYMNGMGAGAHNVADNIATQVFTTGVLNLTKTNNFELSYTQYASHFIDIDQDGYDTFNDLRALLSSSIRGNAQGSPYTRATSPYAQADFPAGYRLWDTLYNGGAITGGNIPTFGPGAVIARGGH